MCHETVILLILFVHTDWILDAAKVAQLQCTQALQVSHKTRAFFTVAETLHRKVWILLLVHAVEKKPSMSNQLTVCANGLTVVIADPRVFVRGCLACWLNKFDRELQPLVTGDAVETVAQGQPLSPRMVILSSSTSTTGRAWLNEQAAALHNAVPDVAIVLISDEAEMAAGQEIALSLGLQGFIPMSTSLEIAYAALRLVIAGGRYFPYLTAAPSGTAAGSAPASTRSSSKLDLTPREQSVCELLSEGLSNKLIARKLGMALSTVKIHVHHILEKLDVENRTEVAIRINANSPSIDAKVFERRVPQQNAALAMY